MKVKEGKDNEGGKRDERLKGGQVQFQGGGQEQGSQIARRFTSKQATKKITPSALRPHPFKVKTSGTSKFKW